MINTEVLNHLDVMNMFVLTTVQTALSIELRSPRTRFECTSFSANYNRAICHRLFIGLRTLWDDNHDN